MSDPHSQLEDQLAESNQEIARLRTANSRKDRLLRGVRSFVADPSTSHVRGPNFDGNRNEALRAIDAEAEGFDRQERPDLTGAEEVADDRSGG